MKNISNFKGVIETKGIDLTDELGSIAFADETEGELLNLESGMPLAKLCARQKRVNDAAFANFAAMGDLAYKNEETVIQALLLAVNPVGTILINTSGTSPSTYIGGTWVAWGEGRVPVGVDTGQTEFNTVEKTGGEKTHTLTVAEMPSHSHDVINEIGSDSGENIVLDSEIKAIDTGTMGLPTSSTGGGEAHNNLQPYITCYMWKRTA